MKRMLFVALVVSLAVTLTASAAIEMKIWEGQSTGSLDQALAIVTGGTEPTQIIEADTMEHGDLGIDNYVTGVEGFLIAPETGEYTFYIAGDDDCGIYVAPDHKVKNIPATPTCQVSGWTANSDWYSQAGQTSAPIALTAGEMYAFRVAHREGGGGDGVTVAWSGPGIGDGPTMIAAEYYTADDGFDIYAVSPADGAEHVQDVTLTWSYADATAETMYSGVLNTLFGPIPFADQAENSTSFGPAGVGILSFDTVYTWSITAGDAKSDVFSFRTEHQRPQFANLEGTVAPESMAVMVGSPVAMVSSAAAFMSTEEIAYQWYKVVDGNGVAVEGATEGTLAIEAATLEDDGNYYCEATNSKGTTATDVVTLDVQQGLIHHYTFNDGDVADVDGALMALDVVSGADALIYNGTGNAVVANGMVTFGNDGSHNSNAFAVDDPADERQDGDYVDLPNGIISSLGAMTVEAWCTWDDDARNVWQRVFSFGIPNPSGDLARENSSRGADSAEASLIMACPANGGGNFVMEWRNPNVVLDPGTGSLPLHQEVLVTMIHDDLAGMAKLYLNGIPQGVIETPRTLKSVQDINNWIGRSQWGDPLWVGSFNDFRIYDTALTTEEVMANYLAGPDSMGVVEVGPCDINVMGDVNGDCVVDLADAALTIEQFLLDEYFAEDE